MAIKRYKGSRDKREIVKSPNDLGAREENDLFPRLLELLKLAR